MTPVDTPASPSGALPAPSLEELQPLFPHYELLGCIGRGGMGAVYHARHVRLGRDVAIKVLLPDLEQDPEFAERFERVARTLARLNHPGIVGIHDLGQAGDTFYLVMEYVDGLSLRELLERGRLSATEALQLAPQICDALQAAHDAGVVHRDVKPENILVDGDGRARIADFGLVKVIGDGATTVGLTRSHQAMGTPHYMAPEQLDSARGVDHRADIYALGVVLYEMLTGELPLGRFAPPSERSEAGAGCDPVVLRALEPDPEARYQQAREVKHDLERPSEPAAGNTPRPKPVTRKGKRAGGVPRPPSSPELPWDCWVLPIVVFVSSFLHWGAWRVDFGGEGLSLKLSRNGFLIQNNAWQSHTFGLPNWLLVVFAVAVGVLRGWRARGGEPPRGLVLGLVAFGTLQATVFFLVLGTMGVSASPGLGNFLVVCCFGTWCWLELRSGSGARKPRFETRGRRMNRRRF